MLETKNGKPRPRMHPSVLEGVDLLTIAGLTRPRRTCMWCEVSE